jgi:hypothetical protein
LEDQNNSPLQVGDTVTYNSYGMGAAARATGLIVDQLGNGYWRVKWSNNDAPMTHRGHSLKRLQTPVVPGVV